MTFPYENRNLPIVKKVRRCNSDIADGMLAFDGVYIADVRHVAHDQTNRSPNFALAEYSLLRSLKSEFFFDCDGPYEKAASVNVKALYIGGHDYRIEHVRKNTTTFKTLKKLIGSTHLFITSSAVNNNIVSGSYLPAFKSKADFDLFNLLFDSAPKSAKHVYRRGFGSTITYLDLVEYEKYING